MLFARTGLSGAEISSLFVLWSVTGFALEIPSGEVIFKQVVIKGFWGSKVFPAMDREKRNRLMGELMSGIASGSLTLPVEKVFPLDEIAAAARASAEPGRRGKILLRP